MSIGLIYLIAVAAFLLCFFLNWRMYARTIGPQGSALLRDKNHIEPYQGDRALVEWSQPRRSGDPRALLDVLLARYFIAAPIILGILTLLSTAQSDFADATWLLNGLKGLTVGVVGALCGGLCGGIIAHLSQGPTPVAITESGLKYGALFTEWSGFSHLEVNPEDHSIRLYSAASPETIRGILEPPDLQRFGVAVRTLSQHLPAQHITSRAEIPWHRSRQVFVVLALLIPSLLLGVGLELYLRAVSWAWAYCAFAVYGSHSATNGLVRRFLVNN